jgi:hypothetical protein
LLEALVLGFPVVGLVVIALLGIVRLLVAEVLQRVH